MTSKDFSKIWNLLRTLFPASPRVKSENERIVWQIALQPYALDDVTAAVMEWGRRRKFFPDIFDITAGLTQEETAFENAAVSKKNHAWMAPYIRKMASNISREDAEEIHAAGLLTWGEAEKQGMSFRDWNRKYREKFPVGFPEKSRAARSKNRCGDLPGSPCVKAEKKPPLPPKPEDKPMPAPREKLAVAVSLGTGRSREEVLAALRMEKEPSHENQNSKFLAISNIKRSLSDEKI